MNPFVLSFTEFTLFWAARRLTWGDVIFTPPVADPLPTPLPHSGTMLCGECLGNRGLRAISAWIFSTCDICLRDRSIASPLEAIHHTHAEVPLDTGGNDGID
jgi:hypothetical protein